MTDTEYTAPSTPVVWRILDLTTNELIREVRNCHTAYDAWRESKLPKGFNRYDYWHYPDTERISDAQKRTA